MNAKMNSQAKSNSFPACLSSFLKDNAFGISQDEVINKCPEVFGKGAEIEGTFSPENFDVLERLFPIKATPITATEFHFGIPHESPFFLVAWAGDKSQMRWVRFAGQDAKRVYLMNPSAPGTNTEVDSAAFWSWPKIGFMMECSIRRSFL